MSDKKDREVNKLFSLANSFAMDMLNDDDLSDLTPEEIFIGSCKMASSYIEPVILNSPIAEVQRNNVAFMIGKSDTVMILGDEMFEEGLHTAEWDHDDNED